MKIPTDDPQAFDATLRQLHADAVARVSVRTQAQLHQRRRAALSTSSTLAGGGAPTARRFGWPVAASFAAILALTIGVQQLRQDVVPASPGPALASVDDVETVAALDENPDFYLWLASNDAIALASE